MEKIISIAGNTVRESIRSKILFSLLGFAVVLVLVATFFGAVSIGDQVVVIKNFGLFASSFLCVLYIVISGSAMLQKEINRKTIYNILAKAVSRREFILGKFLGMFITAMILLILMGAGLLLFVFLFTGQIETALLVGLYFMSLELLVVCSFCIFFSSVVITPILIALFTFGIFLAGRGAELLLYYVEQEYIESGLATVVKGLYYILPQLQRLNVNDLVAYGVSISDTQIFWSTMYSFGYSIALLALSVILFEKRQFA